MIGNPVIPGRAVRNSPLSALIKATLASTLLLVFLALVFSLAEAQPVPPENRTRDRAAESDAPAESAEPDTAEGPQTPLEWAQTIWPRADFLWERLPQGRLRFLATSPSTPAVALGVEEEGQSCLLCLGPAGALRWELEFPSLYRVPGGFSADGGFLWLTLPCEEDPGVCTRTEVIDAQGDLRWSRESSARLVPSRSGSYFLLAGPVGRGYEALFDEDGWPQDLAEVISEPDHGTGLPGGERQLAPLSDTEILALSPGDRASLSHLQLLDLESGRIRWTVSFEAPYDSAGAFHRQVGSASDCLVWWFPAGRGSLPRLYCLERETGALRWQNFERLLGLSAGGAMLVSERESRILLLTPLTRQGQFLHVLALSTGELVASLRLAAPRQRAREFPPERLTFFGFLTSRKILLVRGDHYPRTFMVAYDASWEQSEAIVAEGMAIVPVVPPSSGTGERQFLFYSEDLLAWGVTGGD